MKHFSYSPPRRTLPCRGAWLFVISMTRWRDAAGSWAILTASFEALTARDAQPTAPPGRLAQPARRRMRAYAPLQFNRDAAVAMTRPEGSKGERRERFDVLAMRRGGFDQPGSGLTRACRRARAHRLFSFSSAVRAPPEPQRWAASGNSSVRLAWREK